jgi:hypothetical protein
MRTAFDGWIAGLGTTSGTRLVLGHWPRSPFGPVSDVMIERADGRRLLLAQTERLAEFVAATYHFDDVRIVSLDLRRDGGQWTLAAGPLDLEFQTGGRTALGWLLRAVPPALARQPAWVRAIDAPARLLLKGVRTHGSAGNGRYEWYGAQDLHPITAATATLDGQDLGALTAIDPPVRFGFGSTPPAPSLVRITTTVEVPVSRPAG